jgi:hypothetical protein
MGCGEGIDHAAEMRGAKGVCVMFGQTWKQIEVDAIAYAYPQPKLRKKLYALLSHRSPGAVAAKANRMGLAGKKKWTQEEVRTLVDYWHEVNQRTLREKFPSHSWASIRYKARAIGLPSGVPQGCESLKTAAKRIGYDTRTIEKMIELAGLRLHRAYSDITRLAQGVVRYVSTDDMDAAFELWSQRESVEKASAARGVSRNALKSWLIKEGVIVERGRGQTASHRVPSAEIDRVVAKYRPQSRAA